MSNRCSETTNTTITAGSNANVFAEQIVDFKLVKLLVTVKNLTSNLVQAFEVALTYSSISPVTPSHTVYAIVGDNLSLTIASTYDQPSNKVRLNITNGEANSVEVSVAELERIE